MEKASASTAESQEVDIVILDGAVQMYLREWGLGVTLAFSSLVMLNSMSTSMPK